MYLYIYISQIMVIENNCFIVNIANISERYNQFLSYHE